MDIKDFKVGELYDYTTITSESRPGINLRGYGPQAPGLHTVMLICYAGDIPYDQICTFIFTKVEEDKIFRCIFNNYKGAYNGIRGGTGKGNSKAAGGDEESTSGTKTGNKAGKGSAIKLDTGK